MYTAMYGSWVADRPPLERDGQSRIPIRRQAEQANPAGEALTEFGVGGCALKTDDNT
jgi:hypothetical protein